MSTPLFKKVTLYLLAPLLFYFLFFALYTWPWIPNFSTHFFADAGDGLQNAWNLWWTSKALTGPDPLWFTTFLHFPHGSTLLGHTLNAVNGIFATALFPFLSLVQIYNLIVIFGFIGTGLTTFWLCYSISKSYWGSLLGGFAFTFSSYHFAHAIGHMNLITLQFVPLFLLAWWHFLQKPSYKLSILAVAALTLVTLSDFYYLMFSVIAGAIIAAFLVRKIAWGPFGLFIGLALLIIAPLPIAVLLQNSSDPFLNSHNPLEYGADLFSPFIPNEIWRFSSLTQWFWQRDHLDIVEGSVNLGVILWGAIIVTIALRKKLPKEAMIWLWLGLIFGILSFGPRLHILNNVITSIPLPYAVLAKILPPLKLAGVSVRMMIIVSLSASVLLSIIVGRLKLNQSWSKALLAGLSFILLIECWPASLPLTSADIPTYATKLKTLPAGALIDQYNTRTGALYVQTTHEQPITTGYLSRIPTSVDQKDKEISALVTGGQYSELVSRFGIRYLLSSDGTLYELKTTQNQLLPIK